MGNDIIIVKISEKLDLIIGIMIGLVGVIILFFSWYAKLLQYDIGFVMLVASLIYIVFRRRFTGESKDISFDLKKQTALLLNIIFVVFFAASILLLWLNLYHRPPLYFLLISAMSAIIAIEILHFNRETKVSPILLKIILLSLNIRAGIFYEFNDLIGSDIFQHAKMIRQILSIGFVTPESMDFSKYASFPIFHLIIASTSLITSLTVKNSLFFTVVFFSIISTILIYLIGKSVVGVKFGLFAMLLANISDMFIVRGVTSITPGSIVFCWFLIILYLLFKDLNNMVKNSAIKVFLIIVLILTHQLSTFASFISLVGISIGKRFYEYLYAHGKHIQSILITTSTLLLFGVALQSYWMYAYVNIEAGITFFDFAVRPIVLALESGDFVSSPSSSVYATYYAQHSTLSNILFHLGYLILLFFAVIGALIWLSPKEIDSKKFVVIIAPISLYLFIYGIPLTGIGNAQLSTRWLGFAYLFLVFLATQGIFALVGLVKRNGNKVIAISFTMLLFTFIMITTPYINGDSPLYCKDRWPRAALMDSELQAAKTITNTYNGTIQTDHNYMATIFRELSFNATIEGMDLSDMETLNKDMVILRTCMLKEPVTLGWMGGELGVVKMVDEDFFKIFETPKHSLVYDNGGVKVYLSDKTGEGDI